MIVLDTNVVSELMRESPDENVLRWVDDLSTAQVHLTAVSSGELLYGVEQLPPGARRQSLGVAVADLIAVDFAGRILPFGLQASAHYAQIVASRNRQGRPVGMADAMIAAIARSAGAMVLATRNMRDFEGAGLDLANPWLGSEG